MTAPLKIAVAGLGVVGAETVRLIAAQAEMLAQRGGRPIVVTAVSRATEARIAAWIWVRLPGLTTPSRWRGKPMRI